MRVRASEQFDSHHIAALKGMAHVKTASPFADIVGKGAFTKNSFGLVDTGDFDGENQPGAPPFAALLGSIFGGEFFPVRLTSHCFLLRADPRWLDRQARSEERRVGKECRCRWDTEQ